MGSQQFEIKLFGKITKRNYKSPKGLNIDRKATLNKDLESISLTHASLMNTAKTREGSAKNVWMVFENFYLKKQSGYDNATKECHCSQVRIWLNHMVSNKRTSNKPH